jgi:hypothetical protein
MNQLKIEIGDTVRIVATSEYYRYNSNANPHIEGVVHSICGLIDVYWNNGHSNTYKPHDLTLIKKGKTMQFTKSDLKTGMVVKQRNGNFKLVLGYQLCGDNSYGELSFYTTCLENGCGGSELDIIAVYECESGNCLSEYLAGNALALIWERTEQTEAQKEMEVLQEQAKALQEQITKLQSKL